MKTGRYIRIIVAMLMLLVYGAGNAWADDITVIIDEGITHGTIITSDITNRRVVLRVTPAAGYRTKKEMILVEKMVNPTRSTAPRRAPGTGTFSLDGPDAWITGTTTYSFDIPTDYDGAYVTATFVSAVSNQITSLSEIVDLTADYELAQDIDASGLSASLGTFSGTLDGHLHKIYNLGVPLFSSVDGGTVKNITFEDVSISINSGDAGTVTPLATGAARIYNCGILPSSTDYDNDGNITGFTGSSVSGSGNVGGIVGTLDGTARVINCYSYANITGGSNKGGIVGYNSYASKYNDLKTMVMNCMFYGDISTSGTISPIYGGEEISNDYNANTNNRLNNYNYFLYEAPFSRNNTTTNPIISKYNCALAAEKRFLVRFEFYRNLLNSTRELAAWYATGNAANGKGIGDANKMAKWVLDKSVAPYPILKVQGKYPSVVNYDPEYTYDETGSKVLRTSVSERNQGKNLGELTVNISIGSGWPEGASIKTGMSQITLQRTDKDTLNYNFNYDKVQLPYYNDVGTKNYTKNKVVTGWKIVSMSGGTPGGYTETNYDAPNYNYADREHYGKDIYTSGAGNSGRIYPQGGYFNVPTGVTSITIEPYWGKAAYLSDACYDRYGYNNSDDLTLLGGGQRYTNGDSYSINGDNQVVYTTAANALNALSGVTSPTVYDYAIVLVGNYHHHATLGRNGPEISDGTKPFTIMSIDLNEDDEPDYCLIYRSGKNKAISPIRFDFITVPGMAMAHKMATHGDLAIPGNCTPKGWFEITTTGLIKYGQFEHSYSGKTLAPVIFMGGVIDQFVANNTGKTEAFNNKTQYMLFGDNVWFKMLSNGNHMDKSQPMPHRPISITGGEFGSLYLSGYFRPDATACTTGNGDNNAECYIDGGKFGEVAGASQENISGNVTWLIDHADMKSFYGGGLKVINNGSQITGNISTTIKNSHVNLFCGGPKFGDMAADKTVVTTATDCVFGTYFGAGYGGTSIYRECPAAYNQYQVKNYDFNSWVSGSYDSNRGKFTSGKGVACGYEYEHFAGSDGNVGRLYLKYASFSLAKTNNVTSSLTRCEVTGNFYGGGSLGKVEGDVKSTLNSCTVHGSVFGAGYSATMPPVSIMKTGGFTVNGVATNPNYNETTGVYEKADLPALEDFNWTHVQSLGDNAQAIDGTSVKTSVELTGLGTVSGKVTLNIEDNTSVAGSVYGGGEESGVDGDTEVNVTSGTIGAEGQGGVEYGNVYGGGKGKRDKVSAGFVKGHTKVQISNGSIYHNVYGGGAYGSVGDFEYNASGMPVGLKAGAAEHSGETEVYITGGTFGWNGKENGMVFGSSRGDVGAPGNIEDKMAWVYDTRVVIGDTIATETTTDAPIIKGSVYGGGENGHNFHNGYVRINGGTIGIAEGTPVTSGGVEYSGAAYPYRGNVYGGGCGTDMYYSDPSGIANPYDGNGDLYNPMAGIVQGDAIVDITAGHVIRNVYGAGAMGSVGIVNANGTTNGGLTTINISGGTVGVEGIAGDGNVYGAARGDLHLTGDDLARVRETRVLVSNGFIKGNVYGGGELGDVGIITKNTTDYNYTWTGKDGQANTSGNNAISGTNNNTGICTVNVSGGTIGTSSGNGNVFGGGKGVSNTYWCEKAIAYSTKVNVSAGTVYGTVYGGGEIGRVEDDTKVTIGEGTSNPIVEGNVFGAGKGVETHGYSALVRGNTEVVVQGNAEIWNSVYGGGEIASVGRFNIEFGLPTTPKSGGSCKVTIQGNAHVGLSGTDHNVFGSCKGVTPNHVATGTIDERSKCVQTYANRPAGAENQTWEYYVDKDGHKDTKYVWEYLDTEDKYLAFLQTLALASHTDVSIDGTASVYGSVYGGGQRGITLGRVNVDITGGTVAQDVYGGGALADTNKGNWKANNYESATELNTGESITDLYTRSGNGTTVPYQYTKITNPNTAFSSGSYYRLVPTWSDTNRKSTLYTTTVSLTGGTVHDVYGGGLGDATTPAYVYGDVLVELNKDVEDTAKGCIAGQIFGCNNINGTPKGAVMVHVHKTQRAGATQIVNVGDGTNEGDVTNAKVFGTLKDNGDFDLSTFDVKAVYGGGNQAAYVPIDLENGKTDVIIDGCDRTSIGQVYGGGNAASVPATNVVINASYELGEVFGGGNGKDPITKNGVQMENPGANVGFKDYSEVEETYNTKEKRQAEAFRSLYEYGTGEAQVDVEGGLIRAVFGGSNTKGNVRYSAVGILNEAKDGGVPICPYHVDEAYGGGKSADMDGLAELLVECIPGMSVIYGGAQNANVYNDILLDITDGNYDRVFGGNNKGGTISGSITVNVEETGCNPIIIGELYGCGNQAPYITPEGKNGPTINLRSFTSIGQVFGGGYGENATVTGDIYVNINVTDGDYAAQAFAGESKVNGTIVCLPKEANSIGVIGTVFGGGNAAEVIGSTHVNIGTESSVTYVTGDQQSHPVKGVKIIGNVYGGGNKARVTGNADVIIGKEL